MTDSIANMIIQLKNGSAVQKPFVLVPYSNLKMAIAEVLVAEGFLSAATKKGKKVKKYIQCDLVYKTDGKPAINQVKRISKPSCRVYKKSDELYVVRQGEGLSVISTSKGIMTDKQARTEKVGGELLFNIW